MRIKTHFPFFLCMLFCCFLQLKTHAQCVNSFPYHEDFEASDGGWVTGSTSASVPSDWEWGAPVKSVINAAASGSKCWIAGGLSNPAYNDGERSYLQSPCFDISSLSYPEISFKVFWETERKYDGASFQFTTDGGASWQTLGTINSNNNCLGSNWFNYDPVFFLTGPGWSGNIQSTSGSCQGGGGSGAWVTAKHSLQNIVGANAVSFRFFFAAGLTCNNFDGFAIDDINIDETPPNAAGFTFTCSGNNTVDFVNTYVGCKTSVSWDFGDASNSLLDNPTHVFPGPGTYPVILTTNFATGPSLNIQSMIKVIEATATITSNIKCEGDKNGAITVNVNPSGTYNYTWDTNPVLTTASISSLGVGTYTVTITGTNVCSISLPVQLTTPDKLVVAPTVWAAGCGLNNGYITTAVTGGTMPYNYTWSTNETTSSIHNLASGNYALSVTDANGCIANFGSIFLDNKNNIVTPVLGNGGNLCPGQKIILDPGNFASYKWQDNSTSSTYTVNSAGTYSVTVTDGYGCTGFASVTIGDLCSDIYFPSAFTPNTDNRNDEFGPLPLYALSSLKDYNLTIYGRWGEVVFKTNDPFKKWNGTYKGKQLPTQTLTWIATYIPEGLLPVLQKGTITIFR